MTLKEKTKYKILGIPLPKESQGMFRYDDVKEAVYHFRKVYLENNQVEARHLLKKYDEIFGDFNR